MARKRISRALVKERQRTAQLSSDLKHLKGIASLYGIREKLGEALLVRLQDHVARLQEVIVKRTRPTPTDMVELERIVSLEEYASQISSGFDARQEAMERGIPEFLRATANLERPCRKPTTRSTKRSKRSSSRKAKIARKRKPARRR